jgi:cytochrome P450
MTMIRSVRKISSQLPPLLSDEVGQDPPAFYRRLRAEAPVVRDPDLDAYLVSTYAGVASVYKDTRFSTRAYAGTLDAVHGRTVLSLDGLAHAKNRALLTPHFRGQGLEAVHGLIHGTAAKILQEIVPERARKLAQELADDGEPGDVDLIARFAHRYPIAVIADMLGLPESDHEVFAGWYGRIMAFVSNLSRDPMIHQDGMEARQQLADYMGPLIASRRSGSGGDLISALVASEVDGYRMSDDEVRAYISLLLTAGGETTDKAFGSLCRNLLVGGEWARVHDDRALVDAAIAETLRFSPPSQITTRMAEEDVELEGETIPAGSTTLLIAASANRDEARFADSESFVLGREDLDPKRAFSGAAGHLSFGTGRHFCLGAMLAKTEMEVGLNLLLDAFPDMHLAEGADPVDVGLRTRGPKDLYVALTA